MCPSVWRTWLSSSGSFQLSLSLTSDHHLWFEFECSRPQRIPYSLSPIHSTLQGHRLPVLYDLEKEKTYTCMMLCRKRQRVGWSWRLKRLTSRRDDWLDVSMFGKGFHALFFGHVEDQTFLDQVLHLKVRPQHQQNNKEIEGLLKKKSQ